MVKNLSFWVKHIKKNQNYFLHLEKQIQKINGLDKKLFMAQKAADFAVTHITDIFSSSVVEDVFLNLARNIHCDIPTTYHKNTILHVMTEAYVSGGHTRCVERWISGLPSFQHSCVILKQKAAIPALLENNIVSSGGVLTCCPLSEDIIKKATKLRQYASQFEYVVLHTHMNDSIPLIAFGTTDFKRPVLLFNHADHLFWLGASIADYVADLNFQGHQTTIQKRGIIRASILGIPSENISVLTKDKESSRKKLGIDLKKKVVFSSGNPKKYFPLEWEKSFYDIINDIIKEIPDVLFIIVGIKGNKEFWPELLKKYPENIIIKNRLDYKTEYQLYLATADLVLDSMPAGGCTAIIDAIKAAKPVLTLVKFQSDFLVKSTSFCADYKTFIKKALKILENPAYAQKIYEDLYTKWKDETKLEAWQKRCKNILKELPKEHHIYKFKRTISNKITDISLKTCSWIEKSPSLFNTIREFIKNLKKTLKYYKEKKSRIKIFEGLK